MTGRRRGHNLPKRGLLYNNSAAFFITTGRRRIKTAGAQSRARANRAFELGHAASPPLTLTSNINASGADQAGVRLYNERLLLSLVRRFGPLSKIEVARLTGLSVQSTSAIMNRLQADGLLKREAPLRGRVGCSRFVRLAR